MVVLVAALSGLAGAGVATLLERRSARPARTWTIVGVAVYLVSIVPVVALGAGATVAIVLFLEHTAVAATVIPMVRATLPDTRQR